MIRKSVCLGVDRCRVFEKDHAPLSSVYHGAPADGSAWIGGGCGDHD